MSEAGMMRGTRFEMQGLRVFQAGRNGKHIMYFNSLT